MKLLNITNRYYIFIALDLLLLGNAFLAYKLLNFTDNEVTRHMLIEKQEIDDQIHDQKQLQNMHFDIGDEIEVEPITRFTTFRVSLTDTVKYDKYEKARVPYRILSYEQEINNIGYKIRITKRLTQRVSVISGILIVVALTGFVVVGCFYILNKWFSIKVWYPFYSALNALKNFDLRKDEDVKFEYSVVEEFRTMNVELARLMNKVSHDYKNLKEFTENISHETQTPLAIIHSRLDVLIQSENLSQQQREQIRSTLDAVNRLSKMNKGLILLAKIDNNQFYETKQINIGGILARQLDDLEMFINAKELKVVTSIDSKQTIRLNEHLADILITNLISNAIRYNKPGGVLSLTFKNNSLSVANSGEPLTISPNEIFERFKKGTHFQGVGLGLAIVKKICDFLQCEVVYSYNQQMHTFTVTFPEDKTSGRA